MNRPDVLAAIDGEREYQVAKWGEADALNNIGDFIVYMTRELEKARDAYVAPNAPVLYRDAAMAGIRKVATLGVAAMEKFGTGTPR